MTDDGGAPATTGDPFLYKLLRSLREYHDRVDNKQLQTLLLQHQLTDKHPLCHLLLEGSILAEYTSPSSTIKNNSKTDFSAEDPPDAFVYWLVLSTCVLQRLVAHVKSNLACAVGAAWLSQTVTHTLLKHLPAKPERLTSASARSVVGRALIAVGTATTEALHALSAALLLPITAASSNHQEDVTAQHLATSIQACVLALDSVTVNPQTPVPTTNASTTASTTTTTGPQVYWDQTVLSWEKATDAVFHDDNNNNNNNNNALRSILASTELDWSLAEDCWQALCTVSRKGPRTASAESPVVSSLTTFKRTSRRPPTTASNPTPKTNPATSVLKNSAATEGISDSFNSIGSSAAAATAAAPGVLLILLQAFERLFQQDTTHSISLDGRLALKRWTAVALTWYGSGQEKLLVSVLRLLEAASAHSWRAEQCERTVVLFGPDQSTTVSAETEAAEEIAVPAAVEKEPPPPPSESKSKKKKKSEPPKLANEPEQTVVVVSVPSNVALITLVCRLCRIVWEIGHAAGTRPPAAGGFDTYMKAVTGTAPKKGKKLVRAELRDLAMIASYHLIQCHHACLIENYSYSSNVALVVNEDTAEDCRRRIPSSRTQKLVTGEDISSYQALYFYYPFVHKAIDELANAAAANAAGHSMPQQLYKWSDRIEYAASAFVFGAQQQVLDARLTNFAVSKLVSCLSSKTTTSGLTADAAVSSTVVSSSGVGSNNINNPSPPPKKKKDSLKLDQPLPVPSLPQSTGKQAVSRKRKSARAAAVARDLTPFCSFAGIYDERSKGDNNTSNTELTCDEKLALFIRAMSGESALSSHLIWIVEACYDTRFTEVLQSHLDNNTTDAAVVTENKTREADTLATSSLSRPSKRRKKSGGVSSGKIKAELSTHDQQATLPYLCVLSGRMRPIDYVLPTIC